jgi:iron(III) transport system ATP-binding protein
VTGPSPVVEVERVSKRFGQRTVVDQVSFAVERGQVLALLGPSGSGKTTLLRMLAGLEAPDLGRILIAGEVVSGPGRFVPPERRRVGFVFQSFALFPHLTVEENAAFGARARDPVDRLLTQVRLGPRRAARVDTLSGGEQQRVALARALAAEPGVVLLDEPFANLDSALRRHVRDELARTLRAVAATVVLVTHDAGEAFALADQLFVLAEGHVLQTGTPEEVYRAPATLEVAERTGEVVRLRGQSGPGQTVCCALGTLEATCALPPDREVIIALRPESLVVGQGETTARVLGRVFEGPTTCLRLEVAGVELTARAVGPCPASPGDEVPVSVSGPVTAYLEGGGP